ncbi:unnamed protein product, partial [Chrysoparadoxa australica]
RYHHNFRAKVCPALLKENGQCWFVLVVALFVYVPLAVTSEEKTLLLILWLSTLVGVVLGLSSIPWLCKVNDIYNLSKELGLVATLQTTLVGANIVTRQRGAGPLVTFYLLLIFHSVILWVSNIAPMVNAKRFRIDSNDPGRRHKSSFLRSSSIQT